MKKKVWERRFLKTLKPLSKDERYSALAYYQELYDDKTESGICEEEILREFGEPERCAYRILLGEENTDSATPPSATYAKTARQMRTYSLAEIIGFQMAQLDPMVFEILNDRRAYGAAAPLPLNVG